MIVYILGIDHHIQFECSCDFAEKREELEKYITDNLKRLKIDLIAEELNEDEDDAYYCDASNCTIPKSLAIDLGIAHIAVDPSASTRKRRAIKSRRQLAQELRIHRNDNNYTSEEEKKINELASPHDRKRERYWLSKIQGISKNSILFICGYAHVPHFLDLLKSSKIKSKHLKDFK